MKNKVADLKAAMKPFSDEINISQGALIIMASDGEEGVFAAKGQRRLLLSLFKRFFERDQDLFLDVIKTFFYQKNQIKMKLNEDCYEQMQKAFANVEAANAEFAKQYDLLPENIKPKFFLFSLVASPVIEDDSDNDEFELRQIGANVGSQQVIQQALVRTMSAHPKIRSLFAGAMSLFLLKKQDDGE